MIKKHPSKVVLEGRGTVSIKPSDHIATGGEGSAYRLNDTVVKLYTNPERMKKGRMADKIIRLAELNHPAIVAPQGLATNAKGEALGFYMPFVSGDPMARIFNNDFRAANKFGDKQSSTVSERMREAMHYAHSMNSLMVDANELNWLIDLSKDPVPYAIDVDSWQIDQWQPTAIMPSIRDWQTKGFSELTDWFAWGVVTFQIYTGIHPYKGTLPGFKKGDVEGRMKQNASIFRPDTRLNGAVRDMSCIPTGLASWYEAVFENGERSEPPSPLATAVVPKAAKTLRKVISSNTTLSYKKMFSKTNDGAIRIFPCGAALFKSGAMIDLVSQREIINNCESNCEIIRVDNGWLVASASEEKSDFVFINAVSFEKKEICSLFSPRGILRYENRLFLISRKDLSEIVMPKIGKPNVGFGNAWDVMVNATSFFDGLGVMDALGAAYLILPFGPAACAHMRTKELDGMKVVNAKAGHRFATCIVADKTGQLHKQEYHFNKDYSDYSFYSVETDSTELNVAILEKGVCATIVEDGELIIFVPSNGQVKKLKDSHVRADMRLQAYGERVLFSDGDSIWHMQAN